MYFEKLTTRSLTASSHLCIAKFNSLRQILVEDGSDGAVPEKIVDIEIKLY